MFQNTFVYSKNRISSLSLVYIYFRKPTVSSIGPLILSVDKSFTNMIRPDPYSRLLLGCLCS